MFDAALLAACAPSVHPTTMSEIVRVESSGNPYAIGIVGDRLAWQPRSLAEALATTRALDAAGAKYSVGLGQVYKGNWSKLGLASAEAAFDPCANLRAAAAVLVECYLRANSGRREQPVLDALSCYYSGNFRVGYRDGYVSRYLNGVGNGKKEGTRK